MLRRALVAVLVAVACACAAAPASAATPTAQRLASDSLAMQTAYQTAVDHWKATPCGGAVKTTWAEMALDFNALAAWTAVPEADPSTFAECGITFNDALPWDYAMMCSVMVHEVGHLLGQKHDDSPGSVMSHVTTATVPACETEPASTTASAASTTATKPRTVTRKRRTTKRARSARARSAKARSASKRRAQLRRTAR